MEEVQQICDEVAIIDQGHILAYGKINDLLRQTHTSKLKIEFKSEPPSIVVQNIREKFSVVSNQANKISIDTDNPLPAIEFIAQQSKQFNITIDNIHYGRSSLEELFIDLTKKELRDTLSE